MFAQDTFPVRDEKYKDSDPIRTVERIRSILSGLHIMVRENWKHSVSGYYSVQIIIDEPVLFTNGKGTSPAYALASAYGEMLERLQNLWFAISNRGIGGKALEHMGFAYAPDEKILGVEEMIGRSGDAWGVFSREDSAPEEKKEWMRRWWKRVGGQEDGFPCVPYYHVFDGTLTYLPVNILEKIYWTNGMCAGNTDHEALVQGLSEVIERHVMKKIITDKITPPDIPEEYVAKKYPRIYEMIKALEGKGDFRIIVKDCSLGKEYPAVAIIFIDKKNQSYFIRFGAHPVLGIALERCLTELLQGRSLSNLDWMNPLAFSCGETNSRNNLLELLIHGRGRYPLELFGNEYSYPFREYEKTNGRDNREMLSYLANLLRERGYDILVRDVSFLGFPSFHVIVPSFSEMEDLNRQALQSIADVDHASRILSGLATANDTELKWMCDYLSSGFDPADTIVHLLHRSLGPMFPWNQIKAGLLTGIGYYKLGDYGKAYESMNRFLRRSPRFDELNNQYYHCLRDYFGALSDGAFLKSDPADFLLKFYPAGIVNRVCDNLKNPDGLFKNCSSLDCFECGACSHSAQCAYPARERLFLRLKEIHAGHVIDQKGIARIFEPVNRRHDRERVCMI